MPTLQNYAPDGRIRKIVRTFALGKSREGGNWEIKKKAVCSLLLLLLLLLLPRKERERKTLQGRIKKPPWKADSTHFELEEKSILLLSVFSKDYILSCSFLSENRGDFATFSLKTFFSLLRVIFGTLVRGWLAHSVEAHWPESKKARRGAWETCCCWLDALLFRNILLRGTWQNQSENNHFHCTVVARITPESRLCVSFFVLLFCDFIFRF